MGGACAANVGDAPAPSRVTVSVAFMPHVMPAGCRRSQGAHHTGRVAAPATSERITGTAARATGRDVHATGGLKDRRQGACATHNDTQTISLEVLEFDPYLQQDGPGGYAGRQELLAEGFAATLTDEAKARQRYGDDFVDYIKDTVMRFRWKQ